MSFNSKTSYQIYYEEQSKIYKQKGITGNEAAKIIGKQWSSLSPQERKPYDDKKKEYEQQIQREQKVMKEFSKKKPQENQQINTKSQAQEKNANEDKQTSSQSQGNIKKFMKEELQKEKQQDVHKKVVIKKINNQGKIISSNIQQSQAQSQQQEKQKSTKEVQSSKVAQEKQQNNQGSQEKKNIQTSITTQVQQQKSQQQKPRNPNHQAYLDFYKERIAFYQKRFPQRTINELTQIVKEEWNCVKLQSKIQQKTQKKESKPIKEVKTVQKEGKKIFEIDGKKLEVPLKPLSGYLRYYKEVQHQTKLENPDLPQNEIAKLVSNQWKELAQEKQEKYNKIYHQEKEDYDNKINEIKKKYNVTINSSSQKKSSKTSTNFILIDGQKVFYPLRLGGYFLYQRVAREQFSKQNHSYDSREISSIIGQSWKELSPEEKYKYEKQSEVEYQEQKKDFIQKYGEFPENPAKIKQKPTENTKKVQQSQPKKLNSKRKAPSSNTQQALSVEEVEEMLQKKHERKMRINYDDVESEIEDIYSDIEKDEKKKKTKHQKQFVQQQQQQQEEDDEIEEDQDQNQGYGKYYLNSKNQLKTSKEEKFEEIEKYFTKNKKVKTENPKASVQKPGSVSKSKNFLFEMLKQPVPIEKFEYEKEFFEKQL